MVPGDHSHLCVGLVFQPTKKPYAVLSPYAMGESDSHSGDQDRPLPCHLTKHGASVSVILGLFVPRPAPMPPLCS